MKKMCLILLAISSGVEGSMLAHKLLIYFRRVEVLYKVTGILR